MSSPAIEFERWGAPDAGAVPGQPPSPAAPGAIMFERWGSGNEAASPIGVTDMVRSAARGIPILGALPDKLNAATYAVAAPFFPSDDAVSHAPTFGERYSANLGREAAKDEKFGREHPIANVAGELAGGVAATLPVAATAIGARALGITGPTLFGRMGMGGTSGAIIGGADAAVRGDDIAHGTKFGAGFGAAAPVAGRAVGAAYNKVAGAFKPTPPVVPQNVIDVNGVKVPVRESVLTRNADTSLTEQAHLNGGGQAQEVARAAEEGTQNAMAKAHGDVAASFDPAGAQPRVAPLEAGQAVARDLVAQEEARAAAEVARLSGLASENAGLKAAAEPVGALKPAPDNPFQAMQAASEGIQNRFTAARAATSAAYDAKAAIPGEYNPRALLGAGEEIRLRLNSGKDRVMVSEDVTPTAARALKIIDENVSGLQFPNDAARDARPITPADMEQTRKTLVSLRRQANTTARATGNWEDPRAIGRILDEFSDLTKRVARKPGGFSGDAEALIAAEDTARGLHSQERAAFSRRGPGDAVGTMMENIVGKYPGQETRPNDLVRTLFGNPDNPGGGKQAVAQLEHLRNVLGPNSPEWTGIKKATISHFTEPVPGGEPIPPTKQAARVRKFLADTDHSGAIFDPAQRAALSAHADNLMAAHDALPQNSVEKIIARWSGRADGVPASGKEVIDGLLEQISFCLNRGGGFPTLFQ